MQKRYVSCEGPTCSGKTTSLAVIASTYSESRVKVISKKWPDEFVPTINFFLEREEEKTYRAETSEADIVFLDRGYLSTLVFYTVFEGGRHRDRVMTWLQNSLSMGYLIKPHYYLYFDVASEKIPLRYASRGQVVDTNNIWYHLASEVGAVYKQFLSSLEESVPVFKIDCNQNRESTIAQLQEFIARLEGEQL